jgi:hypothetical protein
MMPRMNQGSGAAAAGEMCEAAARGEVVIEPPARLWRGLLGHNRSSQAEQFRREMGLATERPILMTGHQAEFWHPGILAKYLAADAAGRSLGADVAWVFVDQDRPQSAVVRYPVRDQAGRLGVRNLEYGAGNGTGGPTGLNEDGAALECVREGLAAIDRAMSKHAGEREVAQRIAAALAELASPLLTGTRRPGMIFATELSRTTLLGELVERMRREPERVCAAYNAAAARHPSAGIRPLVVNQVQDQYELPLWEMTQSGRRRVYLEMLESVPREALAPRALLMTGLLRMAGCDLFIHGTGGGGRAEDGAQEGYDRVMEEWLTEWLGVERLAPATVVTATRRLPLADGGAPGEAEVARAVWLAHHARHDPAAIGDVRGGAAKRTMARAIEDARREARAVLFEQLQAFLAEYREHRRMELEAIASAAEEARQRMRERPIVLDRTWAFPLHPRAVLEELRREIEMRFEADA